MKFEQYTPSQAEIEKAEKSMTPQLAEQSMIREKYKIQFGMQFNGEEGLREDHTERRVCSSTERESLDKSIEQLADLFEGVDFFWQLDGALNISMYREEYIGIHKDIDISIDEKEIKKVASFLEKKGYGLFLSRFDDIEKQRIFERVDSEKFIKNRTLQPMIIAIDENGKRRSDNAVSHLDTHIIRRDAEGFQVGHEITKLPEEWFQPQTIEFHGRHVHCSHPALVAYYKLFHARAYDSNDLKLLAQSGALTIEHVDLIEKTFDQHARNMFDMIDLYTDRIYARIENEQDTERIFQIMIDDDLVKARYNQRTEGQFREFADQISAMNPRSRNDIVKMIFKSTMLSNLLKLKKERISILRDNI